MVSLYVHSLGPERKGDCVCIWQQGTNPCSLTSLDPIATSLSIPCPMLPPHSYLRQLELGQQLPFSWVWTSSYPGSHVGRLLGQVVELQTVERKLCQDTAHLATPSPSSSFLEILASGVIFFPLGPSVLHGFSRFQQIHSVFDPLGPH